jgi:hypothetical protein
MKYDIIIKECDRNINFADCTLDKEADKDKDKEIERINIDSLPLSDSVYNTSELDIIDDTINRNKIIKKEDNTDDSLNQQENWGGLNDEPKKRKPTYLDACPEWNVVQSHKTITVPLLRNGSLCNSVRINDKYIAVKETCAFDALMQLIMHACGKESRYKDELQTIEHSFVQFCINILKRGKIVYADYIAHALILKDTNICQHSATRHVEFLNANCNVNHLIDTIFTNLMPSITRNSSCHQCDYFINRNFATLYINVDIILTKGFGKIQGSN